MNFPQGYLASPNQGGVYAVAIILFVAGCVAVALRVKARRIKKAQLGADDLFMFFSLIEVGALAGMLLYGAARGSLGTHTAINPQTGALVATDKEVESARLATIFQFIAIPTLGTIKMSVVLLYRRIFLGTIFKRVSLATCIGIALWTVAFFFASVFQCNLTPWYNWESSKTVALCSDYKAIQLGHAFSDVLTDLIILAIPLPIIWNLQMTMTNKVTLTFIFCLGLLSTAAGTARLAIFWEYNYDATIGARDVRGIETNIMVWAYVEAAVGVVDGTLPTLRPIIDTRTPESLVNSVRSKLSIHSQGSRNRNATANNKGTQLSDASIELHTLVPQGDADHAITNHVEGHAAEDLEIPTNAILRQNNIMIEEESSRPHAS